MTHVVFSAGKLGSS